MRLTLIRFIREFFLYLVHLGNHIVPAAIPNNHLRGLKGGKERMSAVRDSFDNWGPEAHNSGSTTGAGEECKDIGTALLPPCKFEPVQDAEIVLVVGEPGMNKTAVGREIAAGSQKKAAKQIRCYCNGSIDEFSKELKAISEEAVDCLHTLKSKHVSVFVDGFPSVDESTLSELGTTLRFMSQAGCGVVVTLRPEAEQLMDVLPEAACLGAPELLYRDPLIKDDLVHEAMRLTRGIPLLVTALSDAQDPARSRYAESLRRLVGLSLRLGIPFRERKIRLAMMLLGSGSFENLSCVVGKLDEESLLWLAREAPFFGIDLLASTFACAGIIDDHWFSSSYMSLRGLGSNFDEICIGASEVLASQGKYRRAGICCTLCTYPELRCREVLRWGVELCASGTVGVVRDVLALARKSCMEEEDGFEESATAMTFVEENTNRVMQRFNTPFGNASCDSFKRMRLNHLRLLGASRGITRGVAPEDLPMAARDSLSEAILDHIEVRTLLLSGHFSQAVSRLSDGRLKESPSSLFDVMLINDAVIASAFLEETSSNNVRHMFEQARQLIESSHSRRLTCYERAFVEIIKILSGESANGRLEQAIACAEREGDAAYQAVFLLGAAVSALRGGSLTGAHVRVSKAAEIARKISLKHAADCACFLDAVIQTLLGERGCLRRLAKSQELQGIAKDLANMLVAIGCDAPEVSSTEISEKGRGAYASKFKVLSTSFLVRDAYWLIDVLRNDCGRISTIFALHMPRSWRVAMEDVCTRQHLHEQSAVEESPTVTLPDTSIGDPIAHRKGQSRRREVHSKHIYFSMLGRFSASIDGRLVSAERLNKRRARLLLGLLVAKEGHLMRRYDIINTIWPDTDTITGMQRLYEATSGARQVLAAKELGIDPFISNKADGTIGLNPETVICDIDLFVKAAKKANKEEGSNSAVIKAVCEAHDLYNGDLDCKAVGGIPILNDRRELLRMMFADAMVVGARAALSSDKCQLAIQLAHDAYVSYRHREDIIEIYIESLCAAGRRAEAHDVFVRFYAEAVSATGMPPSKSLRRFVEDLIDGDEKTSEAEGEETDKTFN